MVASVTARRNSRKTSWRARRPRINYLPAFWFAGRLFKASREVPTRTLFRERKGLVSSCRHGRCLVADLWRSSQWTWARSSAGSGSGGNGKRRRAVPAALEPFHLFAQSPGACTAARKHAGQLESVRRAASALGGSSVSNRPLWLPFSLPLSQRPGPGSSRWPLALAIIVSLLAINCPVARLPLLSGHSRLAANGQRLSSRKGPYIKCCAETRERVARLLATLALARRLL